MSGEKRSAAREHIEMPVALFGGGVGTTRDVSATGLFFEMDGPLEEGSVIDLSIALTENGHPMRLTARGEVVRVEARGGRTGVAVRMLDSRLEAAG